MKTLTKIFSREHTLFFFYVWHESEGKGLEPWIGQNFKNILSVREGSEDKMSAWYEQAEFDVVGELIKENIEQDNTWHDRLLEALQEQWEILLPYYEEKRVIQDIDELERFYHTFVKWWTPMALNFLTCEASGAAEDVVERALARRAKDEEYSYILDKPFIDYWRKNQAEYSDLTYLLKPEEAIKLGRGRLSNEEIEQVRQRREGFGIFNDKLYLLDDLDKALEDEGLKLESMAVDEDVEQIKGMTASARKVSGLVRVVLLKKDISKLKSGEILVTAMTDPDFVPVMKKAAAIVTDEGGVTCHAAIMAREFKIPCIIGTKIATVALKDGDMVEVDADAGIVKKI